MWFMLTDPIKSSQYEFQLMISVSFEVLFFLFLKIGKIRWRKISHFMCKIYTDSFSEIGPKTMITNFVLHIFVSIVKMPC